MPELNEAQRAALAQSRSKRLTPAQQAALETSRASQQPQEERGILSRVGGQLMELPSGVARTVTGVADALASPLIAAERQVRPYVQAAMGMRDMPDSAQAAYRQTEPFSFRQDLPVGERGAFGGEGVVTNVLGGVGEAAPMMLSAPSMMRGLATRIPAANPFGRTSVETAKNIGREALRTTPAAEVGYGTAAVTGGEVAKEFGGDDAELIGAFLAPVAAGIGSSVVRSGVNLAESIFSRPSAFENMATSLNSLKDEMAADLLAEAMVREGITVDQVMQRLDELGPNAMPADTAQSFRRLLRVAANQNPEFQGRAAREITERSAGQAARIGEEVDFGLATPDMTVDQAIQRLREDTMPAITELYDRAAATPFNISGRLKTLLEGDSSLGDAFRAAEVRVADKRAAGDRITHFDVIDATKQELDDRIRVATRAGELDKARDLIRLKNTMIDEADAAIPEYKQARTLFAGERALESAAQMGELFMKSNRRQVIDMVEKMSPAEMNMYRLGARQAILDRLDVTQINADVVKRLFGKAGDVAKLRALFPDNDAFERFKRAMEREAEFLLTRRTALENSTTVQQASDMGSFRDAAATTAAVLGSPAQSAMEFTRILDGLGKGKRNTEYAQALQRAGDILLSTNMNPTQVRRLLEAGNTRRLRAELEKVMMRPSRATQIGTQGVRSATLTATTGEE